MSAQLAKDLSETYLGICRAGENTGQHQPAGKSDQTRSMGPVTLSTPTGGPFEAVRTASLPAGLGSGSDDVPLQPDSGSRRDKPGQE